MTERDASRSAGSDATSDDVDCGLTHIALPVRDVGRSVRFYRDFAGFEVVHRRGAPGRRVVWLSDLRRPFALVLLESCGSDEAPLAGVSHLGLACASREEVDRLGERARQAGCLELAPRDSHSPAGYWALLRDPDGHNLELSHGQEVGLQVSRARHRREPGGSGAPAPPGPL